MTSLASKPMGVSEKLPVMMRLDHQKYVHRDHEFKVTVGAVVSIVKEFTERAVLAFPAASVTVIVQLL